MQPGVGELHLGLDAGRADDPPARGLAGDVLQQRRLTDTGVSADEQHTALARASAREQAIHSGALADAPKQHVLDATGFDQTLGSGGGGDARACRRVIIDGGEELAHDRLELAEGRRAEQDRLIRGHRVPALAIGPQHARRRSSRGGG